MLEAAQLARQSEERHPALLVLPGPGSFLLLTQGSLPRPGVPKKNSNSVPSLLTHQECVIPFRKNSIVNDDNEEKVGSLRRCPGEPMPTDTLSAIWGRV